MGRGTFTQPQVAQLLGAIKSNRVLSDGKGHSHVSQQDVTAHLIRMFGFGNFDIEVIYAEPVFEDQRVDNKGEFTNRFDVCYRAMVRLSVRDPEGELVAFYENGSTATAQNQTRGDAHDLAYKSAISLSIKRAAIALGDQFGLSLYNKGQLSPLVMKTLVGGAEPAEGDLQDGVPQQVSLGNDEIDRSDEQEQADAKVTPIKKEPAPKPTDDDWLVRASNAESAEQVRSVYRIAVRSKVGKPTLDAIAKVGEEMAAKEEKTAQMMAASEASDLNEAEEAAKAMKKTFGSEDAPGS